jgi:hypothetical protein
MTTERQRLANRANGRRSRGPTTVAGKLRSRRNALRHGFSARLLVDEAQQRDTQALANAMNLGSRSAELAGAEVAVRRVTQARAELLHRISLAPADERADDLIAKLVTEFVALHRYERIALCKRDKALLALERITQSPS